MTALLQDLRYALRLLRRAPGFTLVAVITLALGIGANAAIFSVIDAALLRPLPYGAPDRLVAVYSRFPAMGFDHFWVSPPEYFQYKQRSRSFAALGAYSTGTVNVTGRDQPVRVEAARATASLLQALGVKPELGQLFTAAQDVPNAEPVVLLTHELWRNAFGGDRSIVGRRVQIDGVDRTVIGVMPPGFDVADRHLQLWTPLGLDPTDNTRWGSHYLYLIGRLEPTVGVGAAQAELSTLLTRWREERPTDHSPSPTDHPMFLLPLLEDLIGKERPKMWLLMGAVGLVLLIACANVANLLLARAEARQKEIAVRTAMGAARGRLLRQFLTESVVLSLAGGVIGLLLAAFGVRAIVATWPDAIPRMREVVLDGRVLLFTLGMAVLTGLLFGLAPALHARAGVLFASLKEGGQRSTAGSRRQILRRSLVVVEVALATMLVLAGALLIRSFWLLQQVDPGFDSKGVLSFQIALPDARYPDEHQVAAFYQRLVDRLQALPGVESASAAWGLPPKRDILANDTEIEGIPKPPEGPVQNMDYWQLVTPGYFTTMHIPIKEGRPLLASDTTGAPGVALVNETAARHFWPGRSAIGRRLRAPDEKAPWLTVVGVVGDVKQGGVDEKTGTEVYFPVAQSPDSIGGASDDMYLLLRAKGDPSSLIAPAREVVRSLDPTLPLAHVRTMDQVLFESVAQPRFVTMMALLFASVALALAAVGIYGVLAYSVEQRTQEIGVRMALGAQARAVLAMILKQGSGLIALGLGLGVAGAVALRKVLAGVLFHVAPTDPAIFGAVVVLLAFVSMVACWLPARRATAISPLIALRHE
jgi:putative ABC transport system permease protein